MALARLRRETERTEGAGNCAFYAFTLGFCHSKIFSQLEISVLASKTTPDKRFKRFIRHVAVALKVTADWESVKKEMLRLRYADSVKLQHLVAPVLRELAIDLAIKPADAEFHYKQTEIYLESAFRDYYRLYRGKHATRSDDIFDRHAFIKEEFSRACHLQKNKNELIEHILSWWRDRGYSKFLQIMRQDGQWAGDLELARLARYFGIVLDIVSDNYQEPYTVNGNYGRFPFLHGKLGENIDKHQQLIIMSCLHEREVLKDGFEHMNDQGIEFGMPDINLICRRLDAVPHVALVNKFINEHCQNLKGQLVPRAWPRSCVEELLQRNVIVSVAGGGGFQFAMNAEVAVLYTAAIPCSNQIKAICRQYFEVRPRLVLCNHGGKHWENTLALPDPVFEEMIQRAGLFGDGGRQLANAAMNAALSRRKSEEEVARKFT